MLATENKNAATSNWGIRATLLLPITQQARGKLKDFCGTMQNGDGQTQGKKSWLENERDFQLHCWTNFQHQTKEKWKGFKQWDGKKDGSLKTVIPRFTHDTWKKLIFTEWNDKSLGVNEIWPLLQAPEESWIANYKWRYGWTLLWSKQDFARSTH